MTKIMEEILNSEAARTKKTAEEIAAKNAAEPYDYWAS